MVHAVKTIYQEKTKALCIFTDASKEHWAAAITQCEQSDLTKPVAGQINASLAFLGGAFIGAQAHWTTYE